MLSDIINIFGIQSSRFSLLFIFTSSITDIREMEVGWFGIFCWGFCLVGCCLVGCSLFWRGRYCPFLSLYCNVSFLIFHLWHFWLNKLLNKKKWIKKMNKNLKAPKLGSRNFLRSHIAQAEILCSNCMVCKMGRSEWCKYLLLIFRYFAFHFSIPLI